MENQKRTRIKRPVRILFLLLICAAVVFSGIWFVLHEKAQNQNIMILMQRIEDLTAEAEDHEKSINLLSDRINRENLNSGENVKWGTGYDWLALGNSLTWIESWGRGICSTQPDNDYFGIVKSFLKEHFDHVTAKRLHYGSWEQSAYRDALFDYVDPYLTPELDLITIQLGENVHETDPKDRDYSEDLKELVKYIRAKCPSVQIIIVDDFWDHERSRIRKEVAEEMHVEFADLSEIRGKQEYQSREGTVYYLRDGTTKTVTAEEATHPGDRGMAYIADRIIEKITVNPKTK